ncbi:hypothetical protein L6R53_19440 [Myxococcota bacterium]|nr:hypothetical protein [Myxococcota bacterium]
MTTLPFIAVLLATGCTSNEDIWLLQVPYLLEPTCQTTVTHNFIGAYQPEDGTGRWTEEQLSERSDALYFAQISFLDAQTATMVLGGEVWPGTSSEKGEWEFAWTGEADDRLSREHAEGYRYTEQKYAQVVETISLSIDGKTGSGSWDVDSVLDDTYTETDQWDVSVGLSEGTIPAGAWLVVDDEFADGVPVTNLADQAECADATCQLRVQDSCQESRDFEATLTGYTAEEAYDQLEAATQPFGP